LTLFSVLVFLNGCTALKIDKYTHRFSNKKLSKTQDGLIVSINPITDSKDIKKYFGKDLLSLGVLPVHIYVKNSSPSKDYIFVKDEIEFNEKGVLKKHDRLNYQLKSEEEDALVKSTVGLLLMSPVGIILSLSASNDDKSINLIKHNMMIEEFRSKILYPNEVNQGFIFIPLKDAGVLGKKARKIEIPCTETVDRKELLFDFEV